LKHEGPDLEEQQEGENSGQTIWGSPNSKEVVLSETGEKPHPRQRQGKKPGFCFVGFLKMTLYTKKRRGKEK
jgi:hypothetical protein